MKKSVFPDFAAAVAAIKSDQPVLIAGCTASGKSALALQIAADQGGIVVNADAMQVYDNWSVLTARPPADDLAAAPHVLYGHVDKRTPYSVGDWLRDVTPLIHCADRAIIVGGTGLFFRALTEGLVDIPPIPDDIRNDSRTILADHGIAHLIKDLDAHTLASIDTQNPARVGRAWEVQKATGRSIVQWQAMTPPPILPLENCFPIHLDADPVWLEDRITRRFDLMMTGGALDEARENLADWDPTLLSSKAIGAPELISYLQGGIDLATTRTLSIIATRQYAKRQRTWFRKRMQDWSKISLS